MLEYVIPAVGSLIGKLIGSNSAEEAQEKQLKLQKKMWEREHYFKIRDTVADAKAAGLHPLFALGSGMSAGGGGFIPGQSPNGSWAEVDSAAAFGDWLGQASGALGDYLGGKDKAAAQQEMDDLQKLQVLTSIQEQRSRMGLNNAEALRAESEAMRARMEGLSTPGAAINYLATEKMKTHHTAIGPLRELPGQTKAQETEDWASDFGGWLTGARNIWESFNEPWARNERAKGVKEYVTDQAGSTLGRLYQWWTRFLP